MELEACWMVCHEGLLQKFALPGILEWTAFMHAVSLMLRIIRVCADAPLSLPLMTLLYIIYVFCSLSFYAPFPAVYFYLSLPFTSLMSLIIPCFSTRHLLLILFFSFTRQRMGFGKSFLRPFEVLYNAF